MTLLPLGFSALEPHAALWAISGTANRAALRGTSTPEERSAFFADGAPLLAAALEYLDTKPLSDHDAAERRLLNLILSLAHVSLAVEVQGPDETKHRQSRETMVITRAPADWEVG